MSEKNSGAAAFVSYVLEQICDKKDEIDIEKTEDERGVLLVVRVDDADIGRVIGKEGKNISAVRTLLNVFSARENKKYSIKVENKVESK